MRAVLQRVSRASVTVEGRVVGSIDAGWLVLLGVGRGDTPREAAWLATKVAGLRGFADAEGRFDLDVASAGGSVLVVSQFTLLADCRKGRRPGFTDAAPPIEAAGLYEHFCDEMIALGLRVERGVFQAHMDVALVNDGPVTFVIDTPPRT
jgi:D-tyrosyl-tRNA(Tyr) deacylase